MGTHIYSFNGDHFTEIKSVLNNLSGWWQSLAATDIDGDGDVDLVIGNVGENFYLHPDSTHPVKLWINDFDQNNVLDKFLTYTVDGKDMPVFLKKEVTDQFPVLRKQNLKHAEYATKTIQGLFGEDVIKSSVVKTFNYASSIIAMNNGNGTFSIQQLPPRMQLSSINALDCIDVNNDGRPDIVAGGNMFGFPPQFGRLDASYGDVLINQGKGKFEWMDSKNSGLKLSGEIKDVKEITGKDSRYILIVRNDEVPVLYKIKNSHSYPK